jgi:hypothetical protein
MSTPQVLSVLIVFLSPAKFAFVSIAVVAGLSIVVVGSGPSGYGPYVFVGGTNVTPDELSSFDPPLTGSMTNPFLTVDRTGFFVHFRARKNGATSIFRLDVGLRRFSEWQIPFISDSVIGPARVGGTNLATAVFFNITLGVGSDLVVCNFTTDQTTICDTQSRMVNPGLDLNFAAIVSAGDAAVVLYDQFLLNPIDGSLTGIADLKHVYQGALDSVALIRFLELSHPLDIDVDSIENSTFVISGTSALQIDQNSNTTTILTNTLLSSGADVVFDTFFTSFVDDRLRIGLWSGVSANDNVTLCLTPDATSVAPLGIHAAPFRNGNISIVTNTHQGVVIRQFNSTGFTADSWRILQPSANHLAHSSGPPISVKFLKKITDAMLLLQARVLHLAAGSVKSVFAASSDGVTFNTSYITNGSACSDPLLNVENIAFSPDKTSAVFTSLNAANESRLDLWWIGFDANPMNLASNRLEGDGIGNYLYLNVADLRKSKELPVVWWLNQAYFTMLTRDSSNEAYFRSFQSGSFVSTAPGPIVNSGVPFAAAPLSFGSQRLIYLASDSDNITVHNATASPNTFASTISCADCAVLQAGEFGVFFETSLYPSGFYAFSGYASLGRAEGAADRIYSGDYSAVPGQSAFVAIAQAIPDSLWWAQLWNITITVDPTLETSFTDNAVPALCAISDNGAVFLASGVSSTRIVYWSFIYNQQLDALVFDVSENIFCDSVMMDDAPRVVINTARRIAIMDITQDPPLVSEFSSPLGFDLTGSVDVYRPSGESFKFIATTSDFDANENRILTVVSMPWDLCRNESDCTSGSCVNSTCQYTAAPVASEPQASITPFQFSVPSAPGADSRPITAPPIASPLSTGCPQPPPTVTASCVGTTWIIQGNVTVGNQPLVISSATVINGSLLLSGNASIVIAAGGTLQVTDCAQFNGNLVVNAATPTNSVVDSPLTVITFAGYCGGVPTKFNTTSFTLTSAEACANLTADPAPKYTDRSVTVLFSYDRSKCLDASSALLSTGAIIGIVIGVVALIAIIAIILVLRFKNVIRPFSSRKRDTQKADTFDENL